MTRRKPITFLASAAVIPLTALAVAACGGGGSATAKAPSPKTTSTSPPKTAVAPPKATTAHGATVSVANTGLGKVLVDSQGRTLYLFKGASGMKSAPTSAFAAWPPLQPSGKPTAGGGAKASLAGTSKDAGGQTQVTYNGDPLYTFVKDQKPGDTTGEGVTAFGGTWLVVSPAGNAISGKPASSSGAKGTATPAAPTPKPKPKPKPKPAPRPAAPPAPKKPASSNNGIPQNNGGDHDSDNNGGPSDGDGGV